MSWKAPPFAHDGRERGFALLTVMWFLLLAGSIVAVIMLSTLRRAEHHSERALHIQRDLAIESALETVIADMQFNGPRSQWAMLPARGSYRIEGLDIAIEIVSENAKVDLNRADPALIGRALRGLGLNAAQRAPLLSEIARRQKSDIPFETLEDALVLLPAANSLTHDPADWLTVYSGLPVPDASAMAPQLAAALGQVSPGNRTRWMQGQVVTVRLKSGPGGEKVRRIRLSPNRPGGAEFL
ncbi:MAG: hypothetical protein R3E02_04200 [Blastomonas sp.]